MRFNGSKYEGAVGGALFSAHESQYFYMFFDATSAPDIVLIHCISFSLDETSCTQGKFGVDSGHLSNLYREGILGREDEKA